MISVFDYIYFQVSRPFQAHANDPGASTIERCAEMVSGCNGIFYIRRAAEWGGGLVATITDGKLTHLS